MEKYPDLKCEKAVCPRTAFSKKGGSHEKNSFLKHIIMRKPIFVKCFM